MFKLIKKIRWQDEKFHYIKAVFSFNGEEHFCSGKAKKKIENEREELCKERLEDLEEAVKNTMKFIKANNVLYSKEAIRDVSLRIKGSEEKLPEWDSLIYSE